MQQTDLSGKNLTSLFRSRLKDISTSTSNVNDIFMLFPSQVSPLIPIAMVVPRIGNLVPLAHVSYIKIAAPE
jgi:hypothetical protein